MLASFSFVGYMIMGHRSLDLNRRDSWKRVIDGRMSSQVWLGQVDDDDTTSASRCSEQRDSDGEEDDDDDDSDSDSSDGEDSANETTSKVVTQNILIQQNSNCICNSNPILYCYTVTKRIKTPSKPVVKANKGEGIPTYLPTYLPIYLFAPELFQMS
jgi:hypothetical protein